MQKILNNKIKEELYIEKLSNGLTIYVMPKRTEKKYVIWGTNYGSNDNKFKPFEEKEIIEVPNGIAHFLEHKLFEQENGTNSLDVLTSLGVNANAYTTNDHTAYLFECTDNFYEALDELMDYVQHPYFTDDNVEKEKGIIGQEIMMYDDYPDWKVYINAVQAMYKENPIKIDITGTIETIKEIDKEILYKCYNTFYHPSNMLLVVAGDFEPEKLVKEIEKRLIKTEDREDIQTEYPEEPKEIVKKSVKETMEVSIPSFVIGFKDNVSQNMVKKHIAIEILLNMLIGKSSKLYKELYEKGLVISELDLSYEFSSNYAFVMIIGQSGKPEQVQKMLLETIENYKKIDANNIPTEYKKEFSRAKKMLYGQYVREYNNVDDISRMFLADYFKGINSFEYLDTIEKVTIEYVLEVLKVTLQKENNIISIVEGKE